LIKSLFAKNDRFRSIDRRVGSTYRQILSCRHRCSHSDSPVASVSQHASVESVKDGWS